MNELQKKLGKGIYRGIYTEVAREQGCTSQNVRQCVWVHPKPAMVKLVLAKMQERTEIMKKFGKEIK